MKRLNYPPPVLELIESLKKMPGIGSRSAERIALWLLQENRVFPKQLSASLQRVSTQISLCPQCGFFQDESRCELCQSQDRDTEILCVVEQPTDVISLEKAGLFRGSYHILGGKLSPLQHIGPDELRIAPLLDRLRSAPLHEIILALSSDVESEATANYLIQQIQKLPADFAISRLAHGLPVGMGLDYADELTLAKAMEGRRPV